MAGGQLMGPASHRFGRSDGASRGVADRANGGQRIQLRRLFRARLNSKWTISRRDGRVRVMDKGDRLHIADLELALSGRNVYQRQRDRSRRRPERDAGSSPRTSRRNPGRYRAGLFTLGFNWNLDFQGGTEQTGRFMEVRLHPSSGVDEAIGWFTRPFPVVQETWQVGHVRCFLGTGTGRTIAIRINTTQGPNNVSMHFANFRLAAGKHIFGSMGTRDFGLRRTHAGSA